jgi:predicted Zn finger-like uncharacterized protein
MNYARCPACHTLFRVTAAQLGARGGRVRCGQCANVFNALDVPFAAEAEAPAEPGQAPGSFPPAEYTLESEPEALSAVPVSKQSEPEEQRYEPDASEEAAVSDSAVSAVSLDPVAAEGLSPIAVDRHEGEPSPSAVVPAVPAVPVPAKHGASLLWGVALGLLALTAALQVAWVFRSDLAMAYPESRPQFVAWCQDLGCDMPLPRQSGQIGIEASELRPASQGQGLLKLSATLRNRAAFPQAYPDLELTLTDTEDKALARRVFTPKEFLGAKADLTKGFSAYGDLPINLILDTSAITAAGYRLYVFYP